MSVSLSPVECVVMQSLWESGEDLTVYELKERLREQEGRNYTDNAVATFMGTLLKKGAVSRYKKHHSHQYHPEINMDEYRKEQLRQFQEQWYHGSASGLMASLVEVSDISEEELRRMKEMLDGYLD